MKTFTMAAVLLAFLPVARVAGLEEKPLSPIEARKRVNEKVIVQMLVKASKNRLEKHKEIYLDSETDYKDEKNLAIVINEEGAARFKKAGIDEPASHFKGKTIRVTGTVILSQDRPRIVVSDPMQIRVVEQKN
jgi:DNA/RNA endonuclease YhcR with UshA esterase domain